MHSNSSTLIPAWEDGAADSAFVRYVLPSKGTGDRGLYACHCMRFGDYRPDITHQSLMALLDLPLNKVPSSAPYLQRCLVAFQQLQIKQNRSLLGHHIQAEPEPLWNNWRFQI